MKKTLALIILFIMLFMCGCTKNGDVHTVDGTSSLSVGGEITVSSRKPDTFNPLATEYENLRELFYLFYDPLFNVDSEYRITSNLAESCVMADNGKRAIITLRNGVTFSDGSAFTAEDVVYTVNFIKENGGIYAGSVAEIDSVSAQNSTTVVFMLKKRNVNFCNILTFPIVKRYSQKEMKVPIGTGQFYANEDMISYTEIDCKKNETYHLGRPYIDRIKVLYISTDLKAESSFLSGEIDIVTGFSLSEDIKEENYKIYRLDKNLFEFLGFNCAGRLFSHEEIRYAVASSVDIKAIEKDSNYENRKACDVPVHPSFYEYTQDAETTKQQISVSDILRNNNWRVNEHGIYEKDGVGLAFEIIVNSSNTQRTTVAELISKQLLSKGISANVKKLSDDEYSERILSGNYDAFIGGVNIGNPADIEFFCGSKGNSNVLGYSSGVTDLRIEALKNATSGSLEAEAKKFIQAYRDSIPAAGIYFKGKYMATNKDIAIPWISPLSVYSTAYVWTTK